MVRGDSFWDVALSGWRCLWFRHNSVLVQSKLPPSVAPKKFQTAVICLDPLPPMSRKRGGRKWTTRVQRKKDSKPRVYGIQPILLFRNQSEPALPPPPPHWPDSRPLGIYQNEGIPVSHEKGATHGPTLKTVDAIWFLLMEDGNMICRRRKNEAGRKRKGVCEESKHALRYLMSTDKKGIVLWPTLQCGCNVRCII